MKTSSLYRMLMYLLFYETLLHLDRSIKVKHALLRSSVKDIGTSLSPHTVDFCGLYWLALKLRYHHSSSLEAQTMILIPSLILDKSLY